LLSALYVVPRACGAGSRPNIVFIFSDDHSPQTIGAYGAYGASVSEFCKEQGVTPNIDRLAAEGGLFLIRLCGNSICSPIATSPNPWVIRYEGNPILTGADFPPKCQIQHCFNSGVVKRGDRYLMMCWLEDRGPRAYFRVAESSHGTAFEDVDSR
jgi:hypothetical protein